MSDITDSQYISDHAVTVTVDCIDVCFDVVFYHCSLKFSTLVCIESYVVCVIVEAKCCHVKLSCRAVRWLTVEPYQRFVFVSYL